MAILFSSCKNMNDLDSSLFTCTPNPLEAKAGKVEDVESAWQLAQQLKALALAS